MRRPALSMLTLILTSSILTGPLRADPPPVVRWTLDNGLRVVVLPVENTEHVAVMSYLPLGLASDGRGRTQWSHLVEHLTLRTTGPIHDYRARNAETTSDLMHLDFIGTVDELDEGLDLQARWLSDLPFTEQTRAEEVPKATGETVGTVLNLATHKWAVAAWNQAFRHGRHDAEELIEIRGALERATVEELQAYRDKHLVPRDRVLLCIIGGVTETDLRPKIEHHFGGLVLEDKTLPKATAKIITPLEAETAWDLDARHYLEAYRVPAIGEPDHPSAMAASTLIGARLALDHELREHIGMINCSVDLVTPEGTWLVISASVKSDGDLARIQAAIDRHLAAARDPAVTRMIPMLMKTRATSLTTPPDPATLLRQKPAHVSDSMALGNLGLYWGLQEYRFGPHRDATGIELAEITADDVVRLTETRLTPERRLRLLLGPRSED